MRPTERSRRAFALLLILICAVLAANRVISVVSGQSHKTAPPLPADNPFSPSNARTIDGQFIPVANFFPAARCAGCHHDTHAAWSESLHRNAAREPFYRESADILLHTRGIEL